MTTHAYKTKAEAIKAWDGAGAGRNDHRHTVRLSCGCWVSADGRAFESEGDTRLRLESTHAEHWQQYRDRVARIVASMEARYQ